MPGLKLHVFALALSEPAIVGVAGAVGEMDGFGEVEADFLGGVGVGAEGDGDAELGGEVDNAGD